MNYFSAVYTLNLELCFLLTPLKDLYPYSDGTVWKDKTNYFCFKFLDLFISHPPTPPTIIFSTSHSFTFNFEIIPHLGTVCTARLYLIVRPTMEHDQPNKGSHNQRKLTLVFHKLSNTIAPSLMVGSHSHFPTSKLGFWLTGACVVLCMLVKSLWVGPCGHYPVVFGNTLSLMLSTALGSYNLSARSSAKEPCQEGCGASAPLRAEWTSMIWTPHLGLNVPYSFVFCTLISWGFLYQLLAITRRSFLWWYQNNNIGFLPRAYVPSSHRPLDPLLVLASYGFHVMGQVLYPGRKWMSATIVTIPPFP